VYVWAGSEADARRLDDLLWTFREDSFVPHELWQGEDSLEDPVAVGWTAGNPNNSSCLVARQRFRAFREAGLQVAFHPSDAPS
jgi:DNA polymerase-3 subunit chi